MLLFKLILDDGTVKETLERVEKLELANDGVRVVKALSENRGQPSLEFLNAVAELVEVVIELALLNVHDVIADSHKIFNSLIELFENLHH